MEPLGHGLLLLPACCSVEQERGCCWRILPQDTATYSGARPAEIMAGVSRRVVCLRGDHGDAWGVFSNLATENHTAVLALVVLTPGIAIALSGRYRDFGSGFKPPGAGKQLPGQGRSSGSTLSHVLAVANRCIKLTIFVRS